MRTHVWVFGLVGLAVAVVTVITFLVPDIVHWVAGVVQWPDWAARLLILAAALGGSLALVCVLRRRAKADPVVASQADPPLTFAQSDDVQVQDADMKKRIHVRRRKLRHFLGLSLRDMARESASTRKAISHHVHALSATKDAGEQWAEELRVALAMASERWVAPVKAFRSIVMDITPIIEVLGNRKLEHAKKLEYACGLLYKLVDRCLLLLETLKTL